MEVDATGRRCWSWRSAVNCSSTGGHDAEDFEGSPSLLQLMRYLMQSGSDHRLRLQQWQFQKGLRDHHRTLHELRKITDVFPMVQRWTN